MIEFLLDRCSGKSLHEFGIGTGRLALPLTEAGFTVTGVDTSPFMLERLRLKDPDNTIRAFKGDFVKEEISESNFDVVLLACNTLFVASTLWQQQSVFQNAANCLAETGLFIIETFNPVQYIRAPQPELEMRNLATDLVLFTQNHIDVTSQTLHANNLVLRDGKMTLQYTQKLRFMTHFEMDAVAASAGLMLKERTNDWSGTTFNEFSPQIISVYERE